MICIDKLVDRLFTNAAGAAALMSAGKMSPAADAALAVSRIAAQVGTHPDVETMSAESREKIYFCVNAGETLKALFREHGLVH
jgi:cell envelope opacity-associated protein A